MIRVRVESLPANTPAGRAWLYMVLDTCLPRRLRVRQGGLRDTWAEALGAGLDAARVVAARDDQLR